MVGQNGSAPTTFVSTANGFRAFGQAEGDSSPVAFLRFGGYNAAGQIAFRADLLDGREVNVVGTRSAVNP